MNSMTTANFEQFIQMHMDKNLISEQLRALAADTQSRSKTSLLRDVIDDVEFALSAGVSRSRIVEQLAKNGLVFTLPNFENSLYRIRKKRALTTAQPIHEITVSKDIEPTKIATQNTNENTSPSFSYTGAKNQKDLY
jgi:hypothetical protein